MSELPAPTPENLNVKQAMEEWAALPELEARDAKAEAILQEYNGAQSSLVFDKQGNIHPEKSRVAKVDENGHIIHLDKRKVNSAADEVVELKGYEGDVELTPNQAIPALREKRIEQIKEELARIAGRSVFQSQNGERDLTSGPHARKLREELKDLTRRHAATTPKTPVPITTPPAGPKQKGTSPWGPPVVPPPLTPPTAPNPNPFEQGPTGPRAEVIIMPAELQTRLNDARKEFVRLTVERRGVSVGHKKALAEAKAAYEAVRTEAGSHIAEQFKDSGWDDEKILVHSRAAAVFELLDLATQIQEAQEARANGKLLRGFNEWWARQSSNNPDGSRNWKGVAKKFAAMFAITAAPGAGIAFVATAAIGAGISAGAGAVLGGYIAGNISRSLFRSKIDKDANAKTVAGVWSDALVSENQDAIMNDQSGTFIEAEDVSDRVQAQTERLNRANKKRHIGAVAIGAAASVGSYYGTRALIGAVKHATSTVPKEGGQLHPKHPTPKHPTPNPKLPGNANNPKTLPPPTGGTPEGIPKGLIDTTKWKYPWNWAQEKFGPNAAGQLHTLQAKASEAGYKVVLHNKGTVREWVSINGHSDTAYVVNVLNSFNK